MNIKIRTFGLKLLKGIRVKFQGILDDKHPINPENTPLKKSNIEELWEQADFEALTSRSLKATNKLEATILKESKAALHLLNNSSLNNQPSGREITKSETYKTVTILHSSLPHHPGGYSNRAQGLLQGISKLGVELICYTRPGFYRERVDKKATLPYPIENVEDVTYHHLADTIPRGRGEFQYMDSCIEIYMDIFAKEQPNVVHVRSTYLIALPAIIAAKSLNIPVLYEISGLWELVYEGRGEIGRSNRAKRMENASILGSTRTVTMNSAMSNLIKARIDQPLDIGLVPNAVDLSKFKNIPDWKLETEQFDLGYVGSLVDYEGLDLLLRAISVLRSRGFEFTAKIVGGGHQLKFLQDLSCQLQLTDLVTFTGLIPADEIQAHLAQIHTIVLPRKSTPATECVTPLKPFEAMASKRALITSDVSALSELSQNGTTTTTFKSNDFEALAEAILKLSNNDDQRQFQIERAYKMVEDLHSWDKIAKIMEGELRTHALASQNSCHQD